MADRILTVKQPWADLIMAGVKDVENRTWKVPSTLPQWVVCHTCDGDRWSPESGHAIGGPDNADVTRDGPFPFRLWVHAAGRIDYSQAAQDAFIEYGRHRLGHHPFIADALALKAEVKARTGVLLGSVTVTGCHHADDCVHVDYSKPARDLPWEEHCSRWAELDAWHWTLADPDPLAAPIPARGMLGLWRPDDQLAAQLDQAVTADA